MSRSPTTVALLSLETCRALCAILVVTLLSGGSRAEGPASPGAVESTFREQLQTALPLAQALFSAQQPGLYTAVLSQAALALADSQVPAQDAARIVDAARQRLEQHRRALESLGAVGLGTTVQQADDDLEVLMATPGFAGSAAMRILQRKRLEWDLTLSKGVPDALDSLPGQPRSALEQLRTQRRDDIAALQQRYRSGETAVRQIFDQALLAQFRDVSPDVTIDALLTKDPDFAKQPFVTAVVQVVRDGTSLAALRQVYGNEMTRVRGEVEAGIASLETSFPENIEDVVLKKLADVAGVQALRAEVQARRLKDGLTLGNADAGVALVSTLIGAVDPRLGRDVQRVGGAAVEIARIVAGLNESQGLSGAAGAQMGLAAASGGSSMVLLSLAQFAFSQQGGGENNADALIYAELKAIQQQIAELSERIDARFDRVDSALRDLSREIQAGFALIVDDLADLDQKQTRLAVTLIDQNRRLDTVAGEIQASLERLRDLNLGLLLAPCQRWKETTVLIAMQGSDFVQCMARLAAQAQQSAAVLQPQQADAARLNSTLLAAQLDRPAASNVRFLAKLASNEGYPLVPVELEAYLGDPGRWAAAAHVYVQLARDWPDHYFGTPIQQAKVMRRYGQASAMFRQALRAPEGSEWVMTLANQYVGFAEQYANSLDNTRRLVEGGGDDWWKRPQGPRQPLNYCGAFFWLEDLNVKGPWFSGYSNDKTTIQVGNVGAFLPAFADELAGAGVGRLNHCIGLDNVRDGAADLHLVAWFSIPLQAGGEQRFLLHDLTARVQGPYALPKQFCGIVCQPPWEPVVAQIIADAWPKGGAAAFANGTMAWTSEAQRQRAIADRAKLLAWALDNVDRIRDRLVSDSYEAANDLPVGCRTGGQVGPCFGKLLTARAAALDSYLSIGYDDALRRSDGLRALLLGSVALIGDDELQRWQLLKYAPSTVARTLRARAVAMRSLVRDETAISRQMSADPPSAAREALAAFDAFIADVAELCESGRHHPDACK